MWEVVGSYRPIAVGRWLMAPINGELLILYFVLD